MDRALPGRQHLRYLCSQCDLGKRQRRKQPTETVTIDPTPSLSLIGLASSRAVHHPLMFSIRAPELGAESVLSRCCGEQKPRRAWMQVIHRWTL